MQPAAMFARHRFALIRPAALLLLALVTYGCGKADPTAPLPQLLRLTAAEAKWRDAKIQSYSFNSTISCFCLEAFSGAKRVTVRDGVVTSVVDRRTGVVAPVGWRGAVPALFAVVRREAVELPARLDVTFDRRLGFPRRISFGKQELDGGGVIVIDSLQVEP